MNGPVICGVDDSASATGAIQVASGLAERCALPLLFVRVLERREDRTTAAERLRDATATTAGELAIESGHPADRLVQLAAERRAAFLVVGCHGPRSSLLGSISADVSRRAPCPVVVVPPTAARSGDAAAHPQVEGGIVRFGFERTAGARS